MKQSNEFGGETKSNTFNQTFSSGRMWGSPNDKWHSQFNKTHFSGESNGGNKKYQSLGRPDPNMQSIKVQNVEIAEMNQRSNFNQLKKLRAGRVIRNEKKQKKNRYKLEV